MELIVAMQHVASRNHIKVELHPVQPMVIVEGKNLRSIRHFDHDLMDSPSY
jgi:hypothetical protein